MEKRNKLILCILTTLAIAFVVIGFYFYHNLSSKNLTQKQKCPEDFPDTDAGADERLAAMNKWTNDFFDTHPGSDMSDWAQARLTFYKENNCTKSLKTYNDAKAGKFDQNKMDVIKNAIQDVIKNNNETE